MPRRRFKLGRTRSKRLQRQRKHTVLVVGLSIIFLGSVIGGLSWLSHYESIAIKTITVQGNSVLTDEQIKEIVERKLEGNYPLWFSRRNIFLFPARGVRTAVLGEFTRVKSVELSRTNFNAISVSVKERKPFALWCGKSFDTEEEISGDCYFLDENGFVFAKAPDFTGNVFFRYYGVLENADPIGSAFLPKEQFRSLNFFRTTLEQTGVSSYAFTLIEDPDTELYLDEGGKLLFALGQDYTKVLQNIETAFASEVFQENNQSSLEYMDLRFGNKVYYKFK